MHLFFAEHHNISEDEIILEGTDYNHIKNVLRLKPGDVIQVKSGDSRVFECSVRTFEDDRVICDVKNEYQQNTELPVKVFIYQGLPKADKMETVIQKAVELGAAGIVPVAMERSVTRLDAKKAESRRKRWRLISEAAAKQSKRSMIPEISPVCNFKEAIDKAKDADVFLMPFECAEDFSYTKKILSGIKPGDTVAVLIGPEGGISHEEANMATEAGAVSITLGKRILRTETAALMLMSVMNYLFEE